MTSTTSTIGRALAGLVASGALLAAGCGRDRPEARGVNTDTHAPSEGTPTAGAGAEGGGSHGDPSTLPGHATGTATTDAGVDAAPGSTAPAGETVPPAPAADGTGR